VNAIVNRSEACLARESTMRQVYPVSDGDTTFHPGIQRNSGRVVKSPRREIGLGLTHVVNMREVDSAGAGESLACAFIENIQQE